MRTTGAQLVAKALAQQGVDTFFFIMGAPMTVPEGACIAAGMRGIDVGHEQAAAMMAHAALAVPCLHPVCGIRDPST